jgi:hypothetical protein
MTNSAYVEYTTATTNTKPEKTDGPRCFEGGHCDRPMAFSSSCRDTWCLTNPMNQNSKLHVLLLRAVLVLAGLGRLDPAQRDGHLVRHAYRAGVGRGGDDV